MSFRLTMAIGAFIGAVSLSPQVLAAARMLVVAQPELLDHRRYFSLELRKAVALCLEAVG